MSTREQRMEWFRHDRFGMFIHWGLYAIPARGEWVRNQEEIPDEVYRPLADEFNPVDYNPAEWAKLAKQAGMKYAVLTAKHHDGYCLFDSQYTDFKSTNSPCKRDLVREFLDAFRAEGLKVGLYYSLLDWNHPDFPADSRHAMRNHPEARAGAQFDRYLDYMHAQVRELMTNYGRIDLLWADFSYPEHTGEDWRATELVRMVRSLQPHILMNSRLESSGEELGSIMTDNPTETSGDFTCPEQIIPPQGLRTPSGCKVPWECCCTMNNNWGYAADDNEYKSADFLIRRLVECVSKDGNMILNVGPNARGVIPERQQQILREIGQWMALNGESIYGCGACDLPKPEWGRLTQKGDTIYAHILEQPMCAISLPGMAGKGKDARRLADGAEAFIVKSWVTQSYPDDLFISLDRGGVRTVLLPETPDYVIKFTKC